MTRLDAGLRLLVRALVAAVAACTVLPAAGLAFANVEVGDVIANEELPTLDGGRHALLSPDALANVFIFFRPRQQHSLVTLQQMARCEEEFAGKRVHWVAIVSSRWPLDEVRAFVAESGIHMPVLIDEADAVYGRLGARLHPTVGIANDKRQLLAYEPFHEVNYCDRVQVRIRYALHEATTADVDRVDRPERATEPNEMKGAVARRHVKMAEGYLHMKQYEKATAEARHAIELDGELAAAQVALGDALAGLGTCADAKRAYEAARKLDPAHAGAVDSRIAACGAGSQ